MQSYPCVVFRVLLVESNRLGLAKILSVVRRGGGHIVVHHRLCEHVSVRHHFSVGAIAAFGERRIQPTWQHICVVYVILRVTSSGLDWYRWRKGILPIVNGRVPSTDSTPHQLETTPNPPSSFSRCSCSARCCANARSSLFASNNYKLSFAQAILTFEVGRIAGR